MKKIFYAHEKKIQLDTRAYRSQKDIIMTIISICKLFLLDKFEQIEECDFNKVISSPDEECLNIYVVQLDTIKRVFIQTEYQVQSFLFPFSAVNNEHIVLKYNYYNNSYILDNTMLSFIEGIINIENDMDTIMLDSAYEFFADEYETVKKENEEDQSYWPVEVLQQCVSSLIQLDLGYMRYDDDTNISIDKHTSKSADIHPDIHFDLYWNKETALKIGINGQKKLSVRDIMEFIDPDQRCWMMK